MKKTIRLTVLVVCNLHVNRYVIYVVYIPCMKLTQHRSDIRVPYDYKGKALSILNCPQPLWLLQFAFVPLKRTCVF